MKEIQIFRNEMFGELRTMTDENGRTFFVGKDVAEALGYANTQKAIRDHVENEDKLTERIVLSGQNRVVFFINESGLYSLVLGSQLPQAKAFKHWVTSEVLPQIRQTGGYIPTRNALTGEALTEGELVALANQIMERMIAHKNLPADNCITATDLAKRLDMTVKELNKTLVLKGVQYRNCGRYHLTPKYADSDYAEERNYHYFGLDGEKKERKYLVWTSTGKKFIEELLKGDAA